MIIYLHSEHAL